MCETSWSCKPTWIGKYTSEKSPNHLFVWLCCLGPLCGLDSITCVLLMCILNWKACMTLFQTYHVNTWISISLLHIISSTSVIKIYQHFTNLVSPHKKRRRIQTQETLHYILDSPPGPVCQSASLGHLRSACLWKVPHLFTTWNWDDPQPPDPTFIHIKLGWSPTMFIHRSPLRITNQPNRQPSISTVPSYVFALHLPNSKVSWCHRWKPFWASVFSVTVKSRCLKVWGNRYHNFKCNG